MPMFITYASYSQSGAKGLIDKPADRSGAIKALIEKAGGKLIALYFTTGSNDVVLISEVADGSDAVAVGMAVSASGSLSKIETRRFVAPCAFIRCEFESRLRAAFFVCSLSPACPGLARNGPPAMSDLSPLSGPKRTICARSEYFAF
jgi:uncharacterized protein with GYD domain